MPLKPPSCVNLHVTRRLGNEGTGAVVGGEVKLAMTPDAAALLTDRGGTLVVDLIRPTG